MIDFLWLVPLGFLVGAFGAMVGVGGGFILVPILIFMYPDKNPETITSISLAVVFFNALSGTIAYAKKRRIDYKSGIMFAIATIPGSILGSLVVSHIPRNLFNGFFGLVMIALSVFLFFRPKDGKKETSSSIKNLMSIRLTDNEEKTYAYSYNPVVGIFFSVIVGFLSSILGIGGGIIHVPVLTYLLNFPVHIATATSNFILAAMSLSGSTVHVITGDINPGLIIIAGLSIGAIVGAQLGAKLSSYVKGSMILKCLAAALGFVGVRILLLAFQ